MDAHLKEKLEATTREIYMMCKQPRKKGGKAQNVDNALEQSKLMQQDILVMLNEIEYTLDKTIDRFKSYLDHPDTARMFDLAKKAVSGEQREENARLHKEKEKQMEAQKKLDQAEQALKKESFVKIGKAHTIRS